MLRDFLLRQIAHRISRIWLVPLLVVLLGVVFVPMLTQAKPIPARSTTRKAIGLLAARRSGVLGGKLAGTALPKPGLPSRAQIAFQPGDLFVGVGAGHIDHYNAGGSLLEELDTTSNSAAEAGMCFDEAGNLYTTNFDAGTMSRFNNQGGRDFASWGGPFSTHPESCVVDAQGNIYTGEVDGNNLLRRFDSSGHEVAEFHPDTDARGLDWIDLAPDQCTMYYSSEGGTIKRYNVCVGAQMLDFATGLTAPCYALRILSNGYVLVACTDQIYLLDPNGSPYAIYSKTNYGETSFFFALNMDPDGRSFWTAGFTTGNVYKIDLATGEGQRVLTDPPQGGKGIGGLAIFGERISGQPTPTPTPGTPGPLVLPGFRLPYEPQGTTTPVVWTGGPHAYSLGGVFHQLYPTGQGSGLDFANGTNFDVVAMAAGTVIEVTQWPGQGFGYHIAIRHAVGGSVMIYAHLLPGSLAPNITPGARVIQGQRLAQAGKSGQYQRGAAVHLHIELRDGRRCQVQCDSRYTDFGNPVGWDNLNQLLDGYRISGYRSDPSGAQSWNYDGSAIKDATPIVIPTFPFQDTLADGTVVRTIGAVTVDSAFICSPTAQTCEVNGPHTQFAGAARLCGACVTGHGGAASDTAAGASGRAAPGISDEPGILVSTNAGIGPPLPTPTPCTLGFSDVSPSDYFYNPVEALACGGIIGGYGNGTFRPYNNTTRGQLSKMIVGGAGWQIDTSGGPHFSDVSPSNPFYPFIDTAYNQHVISGYADGTFRWGSNVTRGQLSKVIVSAAGWQIETTGGPHFSDVPSSNPFYPFVETAFHHGVISGYADGTFRWQNSATRGQIAKIVYNAGLVEGPPLLNPTATNTTLPATAPPTITLFPTDTATPTGTATPIPTATPCMAARVLNGGFETGDLTSWVISGTNPSPIVTNAQPHSGTYSALLGTVSGSEPLGNGSIYQEFAVPTGGSTLSFWWNGGTSDNINYDWQDAYITDTGGNILAQIMHNCQTTGGWLNQTFDMTPFAGQTVRVVFEVHEDGQSDDTYMYVDDVALRVPCNSSIVSPAKITPAPTRTAIQPTSNPDSRAGNPSGKVSP